MIFESQYTEQGAGRSSPEPSENQVQRPRIDPLDDFARLNRWTTIRTDSLGFCLKCSASVLPMLGASSDSLVGKNLKELERFQDRVGSNLDQLMNHPTAFYCQWGLAFDDQFSDDAERPMASVTLKLAVEQFA